MGCCPEPILPHAYDSAGQAGTNAQSPSRVERKSGKSDRQISGENEQFRWRNRYREINWFNFH